MPSLTFPHGSLITITDSTSNEVALSDHQRSAMQDDLEGIKTDNRTVNGTMRRYFVTSKRRFNISWELLPALDEQTADGNAGRNSLKALFDANFGLAVGFSHQVVGEGNTDADEDVTCFLDTYTESITHRWGSAENPHQLWSVAITLVEV